MNHLNKETVRFFRNQSFVIVSTVDRSGIPHSSCKGIIKINPDGLVYLLDLYQEKTYRNLRQNSRISITAVNEHRFTGYCLKGKAKIISGDKLKPEIIKAWENRLTSRITQRIIKNIQEEKGAIHHPEVLFPRPKYLIVVKVGEVINLTPHHIIPKKLKLR